MSKKTVSKKKPEISNNKIIEMSSKEKALQAFLCILFLIWPLYMPERYYMLGDYKYFFFRNLFLILLFVELLFVIGSGIKGLREKKKAIRLNSQDYCVLIYAAACILSSLLSPYKKEALIGCPGWWMGLFMQLALAVLYFMVSGFIQVRTLVIWCSGVGCFLTYLISYVNRLGWDPFHVYEGMPIEDRIRYLGTIGQASWYSGFLAVTLPIFIGLYVGFEELTCESKRTLKEDPDLLERLMLFSREKACKYLLTLLIFLGFASAVNQNSDSIFAALAVVCIILFLAMRKSSENRIANTFDIAVMAASAFFFTGILQTILKNEVTKQLGKLSKLLGNPAAAGCLFIAAVLLRYIYKKFVVQKENSFLGYQIIVGVLLVFSAVFIFAAGVSGKAYLHFSDSWGNSRGWIWKFMLNIWKEASLKQKLFGVGPNCTAYYVEQFYSSVVQPYWGEVTLANAHNEWFTMLIDTGIIGAAAYISVFAAGIITALKNSKKCPYCFAFLMSLCAYTVHNIFGYQQVMMAVIAFVILGGVSGVDKRK